MDYQWIGHGSLSKGPFPYFPRFLDKALFSYCTIFLISSVGVCPPVATASDVRIGGTPSPQGKKYVMRPHVGKGSGSLSALSYLG